LRTVILKSIAIFIVPVTVLAAAYAALPRLPLLPASRLELVEIAPYVVAALGMFLAVHFHRSRPFFILLLLLVFYWQCRSVPIADTKSLTAEGVFQGFALLLPANITFFCFLRERGILSTAGRLRLIFLIMQGSLAAWLFLYRYHDLQPYIGRRFFNLEFFDSLNLPQPALLVTATGFLLMGLRSLRRQSPIDIGFLGALIALFIACNWLAIPYVATVYCTAAALIIALSILQDSYNMAFRDDLTALPSRRALNESMLGLGRSYAIAMVDVDHFKKFNDTHGHDVGDQVLKMVAKKLMAVGGGGKAYRYGGEEFTILFHRRRAAETITHLEELRRAIADYRLFIRTPEREKENRQGKGQRGSGGEGTWVSVTVSMGVAESDEFMTPADVIRAADKALYRAKHKGRNQVCK
jgi:diguanylate cyclase (GGDEF)-like protein